ncbi:MAG: hypothetical protein ACHQAX_02305 [Gammaproteobacteria bacterium]
MPITFREAIPITVDHISKNINAQCLAKAIAITQLKYANEPSYNSALRPPLDLYYLPIIGPLLQGTHMGCRYVKSGLRSPSPNEITNDNAKQTLLTILNGAGGYNKLSYKCDLLYSLAREACVENNEIKEFLALDRTDYTDEDVASLIGAMQLNLADKNEVPNQVIAILENYISRNTSTFSWKKPESVSSARLMLNDIKHYLNSDVADDKNNIRLTETANDVIEGIQKCLTTETIDSPSEDQKNLSDLCKQLIGCLDAHLKIEDSSRRLNKVTSDI